jgi:hypothetical protein
MICLPRSGPFCGLSYDVESRFAKNVPLAHFLHAHSLVWYSFFNCKLAASLLNIPPGCLTTFRVSNPLISKKKDTYSGIFFVL